MIKCRLIEAVENAERVRDIRFTVYTRVLFVTIIVTLLAGVWK